MEKSNKAKDKEKQPLIPVQKIPNPVVFEKPQTRRFSAEYKLRILREADTCQEQCVSPRQSFRYSSDGFSQRFAYFLTRKPAVVPQKNDSPIRSR